MKKVIWRQRKWKHTFAGEPSKQSWRKVSFPTICCTRGWENTTWNIQDIWINFPFSSFISVACIVGKAAPSLRIYGYNGGKLICIKRIIYVLKCKWYEKKLVNKRMEISNADFPQVIFEAIFKRGVSYRESAGNNFQEFLKLLCTYIKIHNMQIKPGNSFVFRPLNKIIRMAYVFRRTFIYF